MWHDDLIRIKKTCFLLWWSSMIIIYDHHMWCPYIMIIHDHHIWWSYMIITYDDHIWSSYMMIIFDHHIWSLKSPRLFFDNSSTLWHLRSPRQLLRNDWNLVGELVPHSRGNRLPQGSRGTASPTNPIRSLFLTVRTPRQAWLGNKSLTDEHHDLAEANTRNAH